MAKPKRKLSATKFIAEHEHLIEAAERNAALIPQGTIRSLANASADDAIDFTKPQKSIRTAWRSMTRAVGLKRFRFNDLRHQTITELAESGAADATMMALAGHVSKRMLDHYSRVRMVAKRGAVDTLGGGLMSATLTAEVSTQKPS